MSLYIFVNYLMKRACPSVCKLPQGVPTVHAVCASVVVHFYLPGFVSWRFDVIKRSSMSPKRMLSIAIPCRKYRTIYVRA